MIKRFFKKTKQNFQAGFTLIEMALVLGIFGIITAIVFFNYSSFNNQIILGNLAYEIAMQIREAQVFSFGVRSQDTTTFDKSNYGVYFTQGAKNFIYFVDNKNASGNAVPNGKCDNCASCVVGSECLNLISLPRNMSVDQIKKDDGTTLNQVYITFQRPYPEAIFNDDSSVLNTGKIDIIIKSPDNQYKKIVVRQTGYISVESMP